MPAEGGTGLGPLPRPSWSGSEGLLPALRSYIGGKAFTSQSLFNKDGSWIGWYLQLSFLVGGWGWGAKPGTRL